MAKHKGSNDPGKLVRLLDVSHVAAVPENDHLRIGKHTTQDLGPFGTTCKIMFAGKDEGGHPQAWQCLPDVEGLTVADHEVGSQR